MAWRETERESTTREGKEKGGGGRVTLCVRRAWCGHGGGGREMTKRGRGKRDGSRHAQHVRRMFSCLSLLEVCTAALNHQAAGSARIRLKSLYLIKVLLPVFKAE